MYFIRTFFDAEKALIFINMHTFGYHKVAVSGDGLFVV